jgi:DNA polymerase delta subunit 3
MKEMSDDEDEDFAMVEENKVDEAKVEAARVAREERQKRLRDMMDDDDEPMTEAPPVEEAVDEGSPIDSTHTIEEPQEVVTVTDGRRRGRRRVMKKKTMKDEEGYLGEYCA